MFAEIRARRIEQTNRDGKAGHLAKDADEVAALQRQQFVEAFSPRDAVRKIISRIAASL